MRDLKIIDEELEQLRIGQARVITKIPYCLDRMLDFFKTNYKSHSEQYLENVLGPTSKVTQHKIVKTTNLIGMPTEIVFVMEDYSDVFDVMILGNSKVLKNEYIKFVSLLFELVSHPDSYYKHLGVSEAGYNCVGDEFEDFVYIYRENFPRKGVFTQSFGLNPFK